MWAPFFDLPLPCEPQQGATPSSSSSNGGGGGAAVAAGSGAAAAALIIELEEGRRGLPANVVGATSVGWLVDGRENSATAAASDADSGAAAEAVRSAPQARAKAANSGSCQGLPPGGDLRPGAILVGDRAECIEVRGLRLSCPGSGSGGRALASVPVVQDRAYWEVHVKLVTAELGSRLLVGVAANIPGGAGDILQQELGATPRSFGVQFGAGGAGALKTGDVLGVAFDQAVFPVTVTIWHNGSLVSAPLPRGLKGEMWPALFLSGCAVDWALGEEHWTSSKSCPDGFSALMPSRGLIGD
mmetsp:Transcript_21471/g.59825  ORF Transcript_21471/g.59825 Transcript_21471/m.59825 type:complete len:300 (-) Transcript_21471:24-923(-)